jgi:hypothetical protein
MTTTKGSPVNLADQAQGFSAPAPAAAGSWHDRAALALCLVMLIIALWYSSAHEIGTLGVETDFYGSYEPQARRILDGQTYTYRLNPPGYMIVLAGMSLLTGGDFFLAGKLLSVISAVLLVGLTYLLGRTLVGHAVALGAALLSLIAIIPFSFIAATDLVGAATMVAAIWMIVRPSRRWIVGAVLAGALAGVAFLIRQNAIFLVVGGAACLFFLAPPHLSRRARVAGIAAFAGAWLLVTGPWLVWNARTYGGPFAGMAHRQVAANFFAPRGDVYGAVSEQMGERFRSMGEVLRHDPLRLAKHYTRAVVLEYPQRLMQGLVGFPGYVFAGAGLVLLLLNLNRRRLAFALLCLMGYGLLGLVGYYTRLHLFLTPALFLLVAYFLFHPALTSPMTRLGLRGHTLSWSLCIAIAAVAAYGSFGYADLELAAEPHHLVRAAEWLRPRAKPGDRIVATKPHLSYFSGLGYDYSHSPTVEGLVDDLRRNGVRYLQVSDSDHNQPPYGQFTDSTRVPPDLELVYRDDEPLTLIYELRAAR